MKPAQLTTPHGLSFRQDLVIREIDMGENRVRVVKDPLTLKFFYFTQKEFAILSCINQTKTLRELNEICSKVLAPEYLNPSDLILFLSDAVKKGILTSSGLVAHQNQEGGERSQKNWNPLAIRLTGINPARFIDSLYELVKPLFSRTFVLLTLFLFLTAAILIVTRFENLVIQYSGIQSWMSPSIILTLGLAIAFCKTCHELSHALFCRHYGGQCREMGVMFLVFIPCLYCDVTDAWLFPKRRERILVSFAGIYMELILASVATLLWAFSMPGEMRVLCLSIMTICSISTFLINGNPLLRYDGYYILSDWLKIPNLASESMGLINRNLRRFLWGIPAPVVAKEGESKTLLLTYGLMSLLYRTMILGLIFWSIMQVLALYRLRILGWLVIFLFLVPLVYRQVTTLLNPPKGFSQRKILRFQSRKKSWLLLLTGLALILLIPIPQSIKVPVVIEPADALEVYANSPGYLVKAQNYGQSVSQDDIICQLENKNMENELLAVKSEEELTRLKLKQLREHRSSETDAAQIPTYVKAVQSISKQRELQQQEYYSLTVKSPGEGVIISPRNRFSQTDQPNEIQYWQGTPFDSENKGCFVKRGELLCLIGHPDRLIATAYINQNQIELVKANQKSFLIFPSYQARHLKGTVSEIDPASAESIPREIAMNNSIAVQPSEGNEYQSEEPHYRVEIQLDSSDVSIPIRTSGMARIRVQSSSLLGRFWKFFLDSFHFSL